LIGCIVSLEGIFTQNLIIAIRYDGDRVLTAVVVLGIVDVDHGSLANFIVNVCISLWRDVVKVEVLAVDEI
jgi:hypothetical protein